MAIGLKEPVSRQIQRLNSVRVLNVGNRACFLHQAAIQSIQSNSVQPLVPRQATG